MGTWRTTACRTCPQSPLRSAPAPGRPSRKQAPTCLLFQFFKKSWISGFYVTSSFFFFKHWQPFPIVSKHPSDCKFVASTVWRQGCLPQQGSSFRSRRASPPPHRGPGPLCTPSRAPSVLKCPLSHPPPLCTPPSYGMKCQTPTFPPLEFVGQSALPLPETQINTGPPGACHTQELLTTNVIAPP